MADLRFLGRVALLGLAVLAPVAGLAAAAAFSAGRLLDASEAARASAAAAGAAAAIDGRLRGIGASLRAGMESLRLEEMSVAELEGALRLFYAQEPVVSAITLLDDAGRAILPSVHLTRLPPGSRGRDGVTVEELAQFAAHIPLAAALARGEAIGEAYRSDRRAAWLVSYARVIPLDAGAARWVLAVELNLRFVADLCAASADAAGTTLRVRSTAGATLVAVGEATAAPGGAAAGTWTAVGAPRVAADVSGEPGRGSAIVASAGWTVDATVPSSRIAGVPAALAARVAFWGGAAALVALLLAAAAAEPLRRRMRTVARGMERRARSLAIERSGSLELDRAAVLGRVAAQLQHELANPLAAAKAAAELLAAGATDAQSVQALAAALDRCEEVLRRLARLAHPGAEPTPEPVAAAPATPPASALSAGEREAR